jgi:dipeptidyl aminopeptidase/acylaminoacyl peptidase
VASRGYAWSAGGLLATAAIKGTRIHSESGETLAAFPGQFFAWSPSGRRIAVIRNRLVDVRSASGRLLSTYAVPGFGVALAWVDDDRLAVSLGDRLSGVDLTTGRRFTPPAGVFGIRSGPLVADVRAGALRVTRLDGTHARTLARVRGCYDDGVLTGFAAVQFTPDRRSLVYQSYCPEAFDNLYAVGPEGGAVRRLTDVAAQQAQPAWSPDGTRIAFSQSRFTGLSCKGCPASLRVADADGSHARQLTHLPDCTFDTNPSWSPDGGSILVARANCNTLTLVVVSADGRRARDLHVPGTQSAWGPERIAYVDGSSVWTAAPDGSDRRRAGRGGSPAWSNGGRLAYLDGRTLVVDRRRTLLPFVSVLDLAWSPDGTRLAVAARLPGTAVPDVYTLNRNGTDVRRLTTNMDVSSLGW